MSRIVNLLPVELESEYCQYQNYFDWWVIKSVTDRPNIAPVITEFFIMGKLVMSFQKEFTKEEILEHMNNYEFIYKNAFDDGKTTTQNKTKETLGIC